MAWINFPWKPNVVTFQEKILQTNDKRFKFRFVSPPFLFAFQTNKRNPARCMLVVCKLGANSADLIALIPHNRTRKSSFCFAKTEQRWAIKHLFSLWPHINSSRSPTLPLKTLFYISDSIQPIHPPSPAPAHPQDLVTLQREKAPSHF